MHKIQTKASTISVFREMSVYRGYSLIPDNNNVEQNVFSTSNQEYFVILKTFKILLTSVNQMLWKLKGDCMSGE